MFANWRAGAALLLISLGWLTPAQAVDIQRWQTAHGAKVLFVASHDNPLLDVRVDFDAGNRRDSADKPGVSDLTLTLLDAGTDALSEEAIKARLADLAAQLSGSSDIERAGVGLRTLSDPAQREPALALLADMLARPNFPAALLAREKAQMLTALREAEDDPAGRGERALRRLMYGAHPYALSARINADSVRRISRDDVLRFWRAHYTARRAVVSLVGDISRADAERIAEQLTARLPAGADALKPIPPVSAPAQGGREQLLHSGTQTHLFLGMPVLRRHAIRELVDVVVARDDVRRVKPDPELFLLAAARLAQPPAACLVFEDSPNGMRAALAAGMRCVAVPNALTRPLARPAVDLVLDSLAEAPLAEILARL